MHRLESLSQPSSLHSSELSGLRLRNSAPMPVWDQTRKIAEYKILLEVLRL